jgi:hypothetical protein
VRGRRDLAVPESIEKFRNVIEQLPKPRRVAARFGIETRPAPVQEEHLESRFPQLVA